MTWHRANWRFWEERHSSRIVARSSVIPSFPRLSLSASVLIVPRFSTQWRYNYTYETSRLIFQWWSYNIVYLFLSSLIVNCWHFLFFFFFFILFCARNFIVLSLHAPRTDRRDVREGTKIARAAIRSTLPRSRDTSKTIRRNWETFLPEERRQNECNWQSNSALVFIFNSHFSVHRTERGTSTNNLLSTFFCFFTDTYKHRSGWW